MFRTEREVRALKGLAIGGKEGGFRDAYAEEHATKNIVMKIRCALSGLLKIVVH